MANFFRDSTLFKNKTKPLFYPQICRLSSNGNVSPFISQNSQVLQEPDEHDPQNLESPLTVELKALPSIDNELINVKMSTPKDKGKIGYKKHFKGFILNYNENDKDEDEQDSDHNNEESSLMSDCSSEITDETSVTKNDKVQSSVMDDLQNKEDEDDDDIEITDVRKIYYAEKKDEEKENNFHDSNDNNSNCIGDITNHNISDNNENEDINETDDINRSLFCKNVLIDLKFTKTKESSHGESEKTSMEYLLNAISLLTKNKRNLELRLKKSDIITDQLNQKLYKNAEIVNTLKNNVKKLQENLKISINELKSFKDRLYSTRKIGDEVSMELKSLKENSLGNHEVLNVLKGFVVGLKNQLVANQINISQKSAQIHHLKSKLDDVSGRLSEEKITNSHLIKTIEKTRNSYESELYKNSVKQQELLKKILGKDDEFKIKWETFTGRLNDFEKANVENLNCLKFELIETASNIDVKSYSKILSLFDEIKKIISTNGEYVNFSHKINDLIGYIKSKDALESEFKTRNNELIQEKIAIEEEYHSILENFNRQKHKIAEISTKINLAEELKNKKSEENNSLKSELNSAKKDLIITIDKLKIERQGLIKSFEGKLKTQNELIKHAEKEHLKSLGIEKQKNKSLVSKLNETTVLFDKLKKTHVELQRKLEKSTENTDSSGMELTDLKTSLDQELKDSNGFKNQIIFTNLKLDSFTKEKEDLRIIIENKDKIITEMNTKLDVEKAWVKSSEKKNSNLKTLTTKKQLKIDSHNQLVEELEYKLDNPFEIQLLRSSTLNKNHLKILNGPDKTINKFPIVTPESRMLKKKIPKKRKLIDSQDNTKSSQSFKQDKIVAKSQPKFNPKSKSANSTGEVFELSDIFNEFETIGRLNPPRLNTIIKK